MDVWMDEWMKGWIDEQMDGRTERWIDEQMDGWTEGQMDGWMSDAKLKLDRWMDGIKNNRNLDGWMDR